MIAVTGAHGKLGGATIRELVRLAGAGGIVACAHDATRGKLPDGVAVRAADYDDPGGLERAFVGCERLLVVSAPGIGHEDRVRRHRNVIDAAARAGVGHVVYTSLLSREPTAYVMRAHLDTERYLAASGLAYTIVKDGVYAEAWEQYLGPVEDGTCEVPADGPVSWVSRRDLAAGIARLLHDGPPVGATLQLTGARAFDLAEMARLVGVERLEIVSTERFVERLVRAGRDAEFARRWATTYLAIERGEFGVVDPLLASLLGRDPMDCPGISASRDRPTPSAACP